MLQHETIIWFLEKAFSLKKAFSAHLNVVRTNVDLTTAPVCSFVDHLAIWQSFPLSNLTISLFWQIWQSSLPFKLGNLTVLTIWQSSPLSNLTIRLFWQFDNHLCFQTWQFDCFGNVTIISAFKLDYLPVLTIWHIHFPIRNMIVSLFLIPFVRIILISFWNSPFLSLSTSACRRGVLW